MDPICVGLSNGWSKNDVCFRGYINLPILTFPLGTDKCTSNAEVNDLDDDESDVEDDGCCCWYGREADEF